MKAKLRVKKYLGIITVFISLLSLIPSIGLSQGPGGAAVGSLTAIVGDVTVTRSGNVVKAAVNAPIRQKDLIVTGPLASATIAFIDKTTLKLEPNSKMEITEFVLTEKSRKVTLNMMAGNLSGDVREFTGGQNSFQIRSGESVANFK
jgi:hypothetical protein